MASRIEDYALIGDLGSAALVGRDGSIDWLCWPRFDSDACFAALLGTPEHGRWLIAPKDGAAKITRRYRPNTLILETRFETAEGAVTLIDFMPPREGNSHLLRLVVGERGRVDFHSELILRFGYGAIVPWVTRIDDTTMRAIAGPDMVVLHSPVRMHGENFKTVGDFTVAAGEKVSFSLSYALSHLEVPKPIRCRSAFEQNGKILDRLGRQEQNLMPLGRGGGALADHAEGAHLRADRRHGGGAHDVIARIHRRSAQLGLPLLLAARRDADAARADEQRLLRGSPDVARVAGARGRRQRRVRSRSCTAFAASGA